MPMISGTGTPTPAGVCDDLAAFEWLPLQFRELGHMQSFLCSLFHFVCHFLRWSPISLVTFSQLSSHPLALRVSSRALVSPR